MYNWLPGLLHTSTQISHGRRLTNGCSLVSVHFWMIVEKKFSCKIYFSSGCGWTWELKYNSIFWTFLILEIKRILSNQFDAKKATKQYLLYLKVQSLLPRYSPGFFVHYGQHPMYPLDLSCLYFTILWMLFFRTVLLMLAVIPLCCWTCPFWHCFRTFLQITGYGTANARKFRQAVSLLMTDLYNELGLCCNLTTQHIPGSPVAYSVIYKIEQLL